MRNALLIWATVRSILVVSISYCARNSAETDKLRGDTNALFLVTEDGFVNGMVFPSS